MPGAVTENKSASAAAPSSTSEVPVEQGFAPYVPFLSDVWAGLSMPRVIPATSPKENAAPVEKLETASAHTAAPAEGIPGPGHPPESPSFFMGHNALGLKASVATALVGAGYLFSMASPAAFLAGGLVWWGVEGAMQPFFNTKSSNPVNLGYYLIEKSSLGLTSLGKSTLRGLAGSGGDPTALETASFGANALGLRSAVALSTYVVGWSGAFGIASPFLCGLAGAVMYRGIEMAVRSLRKNDVGEKK